VKILSPADGVKIPADRVVVSGTAPPEENVSILDESGVQGLQTMTVGPSGAWTVTILLTPGPNWIEFLSRGTSVRLSVMRTTS
jgi:hypothetical protein